MDNHNTKIEIDLDGKKYVLILVLMDNHNTSAGGKMLRMVLRLNPCSNG